MAQNSSQKTPAALARDLTLRRFADRQVLTEVHASPDGDAHYPSFDRDEWVETKREEREGYDFVWLERADPVEE